MQVEKGAEAGHYTVTYGEASAGHYHPGREEARREETNKMTSEASEAPYRQVNNEFVGGMAETSHARANAAKWRFDPVNTKDAARLKPELN